MVVLGDLEPVSDVEPRKHPALSWYSLLTMPWWCSKMSREAFSSAMRLI